MRARTRLILDIALFAGLITVYKPTWTGVTLHEWLSIAAIVPLLLHFTVNWDWAVRVARTFVERLLHTSRLNFVVDCLLMVATVTAMLSGFMVTPWVLSLFNMHPANPLAWHVVHSVSADATIALLLVHTALHWRFLFATSAKLVGEMRPPAPARRSRRSVPAASRTRRAQAAETTPVVRKSKVGIRAAEAARERAMALRIVSVLGLTTALCLAISAGVGAAGPLFRSTAKAQHIAIAGKLVCPNTGCTASTCHAGSGMSAKAFYARTAPKKARSKRVAKTAPKRSSAPATARVPSAKPRSVAANKPKTTARKAAVKRVASTSGSKPAKRTAKRKRLHCPVTGCARSSCHASHGKSAAAFY